jgi:hypothetical protein
MDLRPGPFVRGVALVAQGRSLGLPVFWLLFFGLSFHAFSEQANIVGTVTGPSASVVPDATITSMFPGAILGTGRTRPEKSPLPVC